jgi:hypothetical protein
MCGTVNPVGNIYCQACNARLTPASEPEKEENLEEKGEDRATRAIKGLSLPTIPLDETEPEDEKASRERGEREASPAADWLDELRGSAEQSTEDAEDDEAMEGVEDLDEQPAPADIPDWLSDLGPIDQDTRLGSDSEDAPPEQAQEGGAASEETPHEEQPTEQPPPFPLDNITPLEREAAPATEEETGPERADIPEWLRDLGPVVEGPSPFTDDEDLGEELFSEELEPEQPEKERLELEEETPEWLRDVGSSGEEKPELPPSRPTAADEPQTSEAVATPIEIPDWLKDPEAGVPPRPPKEVEQEEPLAVEDDAEREVDTEAAPSSEDPLESLEIPSWLHEAELEESPPEEPMAPFTKAPPEDVETPDWLTELAAQPSEEEGEAAPFPSGLERADVPSWLQEMRAGEGEEEEAIAEPTETEGLLKGLRGLIPASSTVTPPAAYQRPSRAETTEASLARAELLQSLLAQPAVKPKREIKEARRDTASLLERWLVAIVLLFAVLGVLLAPRIVGRSPQLTEPATNRGASDLHRLVDDLQPADDILVVFDYGPAETDELSAVARPVLQHILSRGAVISIVSTRPDGTLVAAAVMEEIASPDQYTIVGYRPGIETAVSQLLATSDRTPELLLLLTSRSMPLRAWIEQASARYGEALPVVAAGSAALEPVAAPYLDADAGQLRAAVYGLPGAASYQSLRGDKDDAAQRLNALAASHIAVVAVIVLGAVVHAFTGAGKE